jgi:hypothetical protein
VRALAAPAGGKATKEISEGDSLPEATLRYFDNDGNAQEVSTSALTARCIHAHLFQPGERELTQNNTASNLYAT